MSDISVDVDRFRQDRHPVERAARLAEHVLLARQVADCTDCMRIDSGLIAH